MAPVWLLDRTRVPIGTEMWRRSASDEQLLARFDGPAVGWRRVVPRSEVSELFELILTWRYRDVPCRILQHTCEHSRLPPPPGPAPVGGRGAVWGRGGPVRGAQRDRPVAAGRARARRRRLGHGGDDLADHRRPIQRSVRPRASTPAPRPVRGPAPAHRLKMMGAFAAVIVGIIGLAGGPLLLVDARVPDLVGWVFFATGVVLTAASVALYVGATKAQKRQDVLAVKLGGERLMAETLEITETPEVA